VTGKLTKIIRDIDFLLKPRLSVGAQAPRCCRPWAQAACRRTSIWSGWPACFPSLPTRFACFLTP